MCSFLYFKIKTIKNARYIVNLIKTTHFPIFEQFVLVRNANVKAGYFILKTLFDLVVLL